METVTVQPRFEGNARDFGMVIPTPSQPKLHEMPRGFFKALEVYTTPKRRVIPESELLPRPGMFRRRGGPPRAPATKTATRGPGQPPSPRATTANVLRDR